MGPAGTAAAAKPRDLRLDVFRGIGMFIILIAHITDNPWTLWIPARFGFSDATEIFVFCSGMASAIAFGGVFARAGWAMGSLRILYRIWQVYWVHLGVFFSTVTLLLVLNMTGIFPRDEVGELNLYEFLHNTGPNLIGLMSLTYVPNYFDILPMYLVILAMIPVMVALGQRDWRLAAGLSLGLWLAATFGLNLPAELWFPEATGRMWFFNPFGWQLVFFTGFALMIGWLPAPPVRPALIWLALAVLVMSVPFAWYKIIDQSQTIQALRRDYAVLIDKSNIGVLRYVHFLALAYLAWLAAGPGGVFLRQSGWPGRAIGLVARVGQQSLPVFAASMVMARGLGALLSLAHYTALATAAVNLLGFALIIAVAWTAAFFKRQPWKTPQSPP
jgi:hypothetical protein